MTADTAAGTLNQLIGVCLDAQEHYEYVAGKVSEAELQPLLRAAAGLHREVGEALRPHVGAGGLAAADGGTLFGKLRHLRGGLRATFAADRQTALLLELQDTEQMVVEAFQDALAEPLDAAARELVAGRLAILKATHDRIAGLTETEERAAA